MSESISISRPPTAENAALNVTLASLAALALATLLIVAAAWAYGQATPALGERPLSSDRVWAARWTAVAVWAAAHAILCGLALPRLYRPRPIYAALAAVFAAATVLSGVTAAALFAASR